MNIKITICSLVIATLIAAAMTTTINSFAFVQGNIHLDAAAKALQLGDTSGASMHLQEAQKNQ
jgi:hypothetical protein